MVTDQVAAHSAFGVRVRERGALRGALLERGRPPILGVVLGECQSPRSCEARHWQREIVGAAARKVRLLRRKIGLDRGFRMQNSRSNSSSGFRTTMLSQPRRDGQSSLVSVRATASRRGGVARRTTPERGARQREGQERVATALEQKICRVAQPRLRDATDTIRDQGLLITTVEILSFQMLPTDGVSAVY